MKHIAFLVTLALSGPVVASGWHDYKLDVVSGLSIYRNNTFEICLGESNGLILICPTEAGQFGPLVAYAVTETAIITRHVGVTRNAANPAIPEGDPSTEFFFLTGRSDHKVVGPLTREEWQQRSLPSLQAITWREPENPHFWRPLLGDLMFLGVAVVIVGWPYLLAGVLLFATLRFLWRRHHEKSKA